MLFSDPDGEDLYFNIQNPEDYFDDDSGYNNNLYFDKINKVEDKHLLLISDHYSYLFSDHCTKIILYYG